MRNLKVRVINELTGETVFEFNLICECGESPEYDIAHKQGYRIEIDWDDGTELDVLEYPVLPAEDEEPNLPDQGYYWRHPL